MNFKNNPAFILLTALACLFSCSPPGQPTLAIKATPHKPDTDIFIDIESAQVIIHIHSTSGFGRADFEIASPGIPKEIILRFYLKGLEDLQIAYDDLLVIGSIASNDPYQVIEYLRLPPSNPSQETLAPGNPYWAPMEVIPQDGSTPTIPLQDGYIEVAMPQDFTDNQFRKFTVQWIDFYR